MADILCHSLYYCFAGGPDLPAISKPVTEPLKVSLLIFKTETAGFIQGFTDALGRGLFRVDLIISADI